MSDGERALQPDEPGESRAPVEPPSEETPERASELASERTAGAVALESEPSASEEVEVDRAAEAADALIDAAARELIQPPVHNGEEAAPPSLPPAIERAPTEALPVKARLALDHLADRLHAYPGEEVTLLTRIRVLEEAAGLLLRIGLPEAVEVIAARGPAEAGLPETEVGIEGPTLRWELEGVGELEAGQTLLFETVIRVPTVARLSDELPLRDEAELISHAEARILSQKGRRGPVTESAAGESAVVAVRAKGSYLRFLPALYERDSFMARFLMLFESFWAPVDQQIANLPDYFDPQIAPLSMVRWWADRMDLVMDEDWPEDAQRRMVQQAVHLFRRRGTRLGLEQLLESYTGAHVSIVERRANNFRLGAGARLGQGVALGARNQPHSFSVLVRLPPIADDPQRPGLAERRRTRRRDRIRALIEVEKPAHVTYTLDIDEADG